MRSFSVISGKGGTGKTVFSATLAHALAYLTRFVKEPEPRVLLLDLDFHVRGLTHLMYTDMAELAKVNTLNETILHSAVKMEPAQLAKLFIQDEIDVNAWLSVFPTIDLKSQVRWDALHKWKVVDVIARFQKIQDAAEMAGYNIIIFDTRAGPDNISLASSLSSNLTFVLTEQDEVSSEIAFTLRGEINHLVKDIGIGTESIHIPIPKVVFVQNKVITIYSKETQRVLKDLTFLPGIPLDLEFLRKYNSGAKNFIRRGGSIYTDMGRGVVIALGQGLEQIRAPFEFLPDISPEPKVEETFTLIDFLKLIPSTVFSTMGVVLSILIGLSTLIQFAVNFVPYVTVAALLAFILSFISGRPDTTEAEPTRFPDYEIRGNEDQEELVEETRSDKTG